MELVRLLLGVWGNLKEHRQASKALNTLETETKQMFVPGKIAKIYCMVSGIEHTRPVYQYVKDMRDLQCIYYTCCDCCNSEIKVNFDGEYATLDWEYHVGYVRPGTFLSIGIE